MNLFTTVLLANLLSCLMVKCIELVCYKMRKKKRKDTEYFNEKALEELNNEFKNRFTK